MINSESALSDRLLVRSVTIGRRFDRFESSLMTRETTRLIDCKDSRNDSANRSDIACKLIARNESCLSTQANSPHHRRSSFGNRAAFKVNRSELISDQAVEVKREFESRVGR